MIKKCDDSYISRVVDYIGDDKLQYFYLYADLKEFGTQGNDFGLWICCEGDQIQGVVYRYYDTVHLYRRQTELIDGLLELIEELNPYCITGPQTLIDQLKDNLKGSYNEEIQCVITIDHLLEGILKRPYVEAKLEDVPEIASIMMEEEVYNHVYTYESLCRQMQDGIRNRKRRIYLLRDRKGLLLAASGIYVETEKEAAISGLISNKRVHGLGFGPSITAYVWNLVFMEGKRGVGFINIENTEAMEMNRKLGYEFLGTYARLVRHK